MTQVEQQTASQVQVTQTGENPYLERVMRLVGTGISIAVTIFAVSGILGNISGRRGDLALQHNGGLNRVEAAIQARLDRFSTDIRSIGNDQTLINYLNPIEDVSPTDAGARAGEILQLNNDEYMTVKFIAFDDEGFPFIEFERNNNNGSVSTVVVPETETRYEPVAESEGVFLSILSGTETDFVLGDFYLETNEQGIFDQNSSVLVDAYFPVYTGGATPDMVINVQIDTARMRNVVNFAVGELIDGEQEASSRRVIWFVRDPNGELNVLADSGGFGTQYIENLAREGGNLETDDFYVDISNQPGVLRGTTEPVQDLSIGTIYSSSQIEYSNLFGLNWYLVIADNYLTFFTPTILAILGIAVLSALVPIAIVITIKQLLRPFFDSFYEADTVIQTTVRDSNMLIRSTGDQAEFLNSARRISTRINKLNEDLDQQTKRHNRDMQVAGRIGRQTATITDLDTLANRSINLICNELGFYHAQIFLLDTSKTFADLRYSRGDAGQALIKHGHRLRVGSDTVIGTVTAEQRAVIVNDTHSNIRAPHIANPLLADTRAEMGLPLIIGDNILGVLDIQSRNANVFLEEDLPTYQLLADQLAIAINNAQLREQTDQRIEQIASLNRQLTREAWVELEEKLALDQEYGSQIENPKLSAEIMIRGEVLGRLEANLPEDQTFSDGDRQILQSVAERVSLAIENARLFQETQTSLAETSILYQLSRQLNEANDLEDVLQAIIVSVAGNASGGQVWLFDDILPGERPDWARITVDLPILSRESKVTLLGRRLQLSQYPFMQSLSPVEVTTLNDVHSVEIMREDLRQTLLGVNAMSMIFIPLNMRGSWKGFMTISFDQARQFNEREKRIYNALIAQAGVAIDNRLLLQQTEDALARQEKLYAASRIINTSQSLSDLIFAAVATSGDPQLDFWLAMLEGESDDDGWTSTARIVAKSANGDVQETNEPNELFLPEHSPMRRREPEILVDPGDDIEDVPAPIKWMRRLNLKFMAIFPLFSDNEPIALFYIVNTNAYDLSQDDYEVYRALTGQMSTQIQNRSLLTQTENTLNEITRLYIATRAISGADDTNSIYDAVAVHLAMPIIRQNNRLEDDLNISLTILLADPEPTIDAPQLRYEYYWNSDATRPAPVSIGKTIAQADVPLGKLIQANDDDIVVYRSFDNLPIDSPALRDVLGVGNATAAAVAPLWSRSRWLGVLIFHTDQPHILDEGYTRFMQSIADQVAIAVENQKLLEETQIQRQRLDEILATLPVGVMVLDPQTLVPQTANARVPELLGQPVLFDEPFSAQRYNMYRTGTSLFYPNEELPMYRVRNENRQVIPSDDIAIITDFGQIDLIISAAPVFDATGDQRSIVVAVQDISNVRGLELTLQESLRETVLLYETQSALNATEDLPGIYDALVMQMTTQRLTDVHIISASGTTGIALERSMAQDIVELDAIKPLLQNVAITIDDVQRDAGLDDDTRRVLTEANARSVLVLPLMTRTRKRPLAWIMLVQDEPEAFTVELERTMSSIADMASQAIENNLLVESTQIALAETEALYNANTAISRAEDRFSLFKAIDNLLDHLKPDMKAGFVMVDDDIEEMFNEGFDAALDKGLDLEKLMRLPLPRPDGMYVADITRNTLSAFELEIAKTGEITAFAAINLRVKDMPGGRLLIGYKKPHQFDTGDERYLNAIADSASVVIDNQMLLNQVQSTLQETSVLYQASKALIEVNEPDEIIDVMVTYLIEPHVSQVFIAMLNTDNWESEIAAVDIVAGWQSDSDVDLLGVNLTAEQFPAWPLLATHTVLTIDDIHSEDNDLTDLEKMSIESLDARSFVVMPLRVPGRAIGAIWFGSQEPHNYTGRDLRVFQSFAEQTSLSLEARRLVQQTEQRARQLQTSATISQNVGQILDLDILLPQVVDLIQDQFYYDHVQVFLMDDDNEWALLRASTGEAGRNLLNVGHQLKRGSDSVIGRVTELGQPTIALDTADATVVHQPNPFLPLTRSEMALPMVVKGEIVGALDVQSNAPNAFTQEDVQVLTTLASQIAVAIDNARLYENVERSAQDMSFLFNITSEAASADSLDEALKFVTDQIRGNIRSDLVAIYLPQTYEDYYGNRKRTVEIATISTNEGNEINRPSSIEVGDVESVIGIVSDRHQPQIIQNAEREIRYQKISVACKSAVVVPILSGSSVVGVIALESHRQNTYTQEILTLLQTLTGSLGAVIQNTVLVEQLQESVEQLREVDRLKSQFLASMSHELRTPLNSIIGFSRVMLKGIDGPLSEMQEQDLTTIYNSGNHLLRLINDILDQAKIEANELNLKFGYFDIKPLVESVKSIAIGLLKEKPDLQLIVEIADGLPKVFGDEIRSRQVLLNIVTNAIKFTMEGSVTIDVYAVQGEYGTMIQVDVIDTGMGIEEKDLSTVFEQFRQVDNSLTRTVGGTGLGLPISKSLAEMQGGELSVASEVGVGSTFSVTIPTYEGADTELERQRTEKRDKQKPVSSTLPSTTSSGLISRKDIEEARRRADTKAAESNGHGGNGAEKGDTQELKTRKPISPKATQNIPLVTQKRDVILVEDDKAMVDQFRRILQREGFEVTTADFPAFAEAMIGQLRPSLVILDVNFADGVGWELLKNLKERDDTFDIPVVVTTLDQDSERAYRLGAHTFIQRPFLPDDLLEQVLKAEKESQRERIVIIDDQPEAIRLLTQLLEEHSDFKVYSAESGDEGISLVARRRPDLIILDLRMPGKDGFAVLDELRGNPETAKIPVLVVTGEMDLSTDEEEQLIDIHVLRKTDISQEEYDQFIDNVRTYLEANNKK